MPFSCPSLLQENYTGEDLFSDQLWTKDSLDETSQRLAVEYHKHPESQQMLGVGLLHVCTR